MPVRGPRLQRGDFWRSDGGSCGQSEPFELEVGLGSSASEGRGCGILSDDEARGDVSSGHVAYVWGRGDGGGLSVYFPSVVLILCLALSS